MRGFVWELQLHYAEKLALQLTLVTALLAAFLLCIKGFAIDFASFLPALMLALVVFLLAYFYRNSQRSDRIADCLMACGIFIAFTNCGAVLNYSLLGRDVQLIDDGLFAADAWLGFNWASMMPKVAEYPLFSHLLAAIYSSSIPQLIVALLALGFMGRTLRLHDFLLVGIFSSLACIAIWSLFPSFGPSAYITLPPEVDARLGRVVDAEMGQTLLQLFRSGPTLIHADQLIGLVAFPSMHTVMALMCTWHLRGTWLLWVMLPINMLMIPAVIIQGAHHLVDLLGGIGTFVLAALLSGYLLRKNSRSLVLVSTE